MIIGHFQKKDAKPEQKVGLIAARRTGRIDDKRAQKSATTSSAQASSLPPVDELDDLMMELSDDREIQIKAIEKDMIHVNEMFRDLGSLVQVYKLSADVASGN